MKVIFEGFDGTGKSTLASKVSKALGVKTLHFSGKPYTRDEMDGRRKRCRSAALENSNLIFDRHSIISEHVYRDTGGTTFDAILEELIMCKIDAIIHCTGSALTIRPQHDGTERDAIETKKLKEHASGYLMMYDVLMSDLTRYLPVLQYDMTEPGDDDRVIQFLKTL